MGRRRCCCGADCEVFTDDFDRADSGTVGNGWDEVVGVWAIVSNELEHTSTTPAMILHDSVNPFGSNNMVVYAEIGDYVDGAKYRLIVQSNETGTEYYYGEWHYQDSGNMYFEVGDQAGIIGDIVGPVLPIVEGTRCSLSITDGGQLCMQDTSSRITECVVPNTKAAHHWAGMANDGTVGIIFDNWEFWAHLMDKEDCPVCDCSCEGWCIVDELVAEFEELSECPDLDGFTMNLEKPVGQPIATGGHWLSAVTSCGTGQVEDYELDFTCTGSDSVANMKLDILQGTCTRKSDGAAYDYADPTVSTCEPLSLRFGPFSYEAVSGGGFETMCCHGFPYDPNESDFYIWVTERP